MNHPLSLQLRFSSRVFLLQSFAHESYMTFFLPPQLRSKIKGIANMRFSFFSSFILAPMPSFFFFISLFLTTILLNFLRLGMIGDVVLDLEISKRVFELNPRITTGEATVTMHQMRANRELAKAGHASFNFDALVLVKIPLKNCSFILSVYFLRC